MKTKTFTTKSGETFNLSPVGQMDVAPFAKEILSLQPKPPVEIIQTSNGQKEVVNEKNKEYLAAKQAFEMQQGVFMAAAMIELGVDIDFTEEQQTMIDKRRRKKEKIFPDRPENQFDTYTYLSMICDEDELTRIMNEITSFNNPTAQQVQAHLDAFRPGVPGPPDNEDKDAPKWNQFPDREYEFNALPGGEVLGDGPDSLLREARPRVAG